MRRERRRTGKRTSVRPEVEDLPELCQRDFVRLLRQSAEQIPLPLYPKRSIEATIRKKAIARLTAKSVSSRISPDFLGAIIGHQPERKVEEIRPNDEKNRSQTSDTFVNEQIQRSMFRIEQNLRFAFVRCFPSDR